LLCIDREIKVTPQERRDMPWVIGALVTVGCLLGGIMVYRLL
jgi:hypothetical protein